MSSAESKPYVVAKIDENNCIGCTKCIDACPFDAIIGAKQHMHTVIESYCVGCKLCLPPCPVNCISLEVITLSSSERINQAQRAKIHFKARTQRLEKQLIDKEEHDLKATKIDFEKAIQASIARAKEKVTFSFTEKKTERENQDE